MKAIQWSTRWRFGRRTFLGLGVAALGGCTSPIFRGQSPDSEPLLENDLEDDEKDVRYVGDVTSSWGLHPIEVESIGLATSLQGTGSDPPPSPQRSVLIGEMQTHDVKNVEGVLASPNTALVIVRGFIPPGAKKGDRFDVEVRVPSRDRESSSLRGGWLLQTRLREMAVLEGVIRSSNVEALAQGAVLDEALFQGDDSRLRLTRGRVPGGGVVMKDRILKLVMREGYDSIMASSMVGGAVNRRFHMVDRGDKTGVANPETNVFIELKLHPRYKHNILRYMRVVRRIAVRESEPERQERLELLERKLLEPATAAKAAIELEAIGPDAAPALKVGLNSGHPQVRFHSAEALAYLDEADAAQALHDAALHESAFRWHALTALAAMDHVSAYDALTELLHTSSVETRYGAFLALRHRNRRDPLVEGEVLGDEFSYHLISTDSEPLIHFTRSQRPELVLFGHDMEMKPPSFLYFGKRILAKRAGPGRIRLSRFAPGEKDRSVECTTKVDRVVRAVVKLGGGYSDLMQGLHQAKRDGYLAARVEVDALPNPNRNYRKKGEKAPSSEEPSAHDLAIEKLEAEIRAGDAPKEAGESKPGFFGKMTGWFTD